jgi:DNA-binding response OmpR family regulator
MTPTMNPLARTALDRRRPPSCLIAEDQALIGMALEADLEDAGLRPSEPFPSTAAALAWLAIVTPDLAILDFRLRDGDCTDLATELMRRRVPLVFYSGCPQEPGLPPELRNVPWIEKPCDRTALLAALAAAAPLLFVDGDGPPQSRAGRGAILAAL